MSIRHIEKIENIAHPLEEYFNIESGSTEVVRYERKTELLKYEEFDEKDSELEQTYQEIYDAAMTGFDTLKDIMDTADTKVVARLAEVGVQHLNAALAAASKKAHLKENKDKLIARAKAAGPKNLSQTMIVISGNRNDILKQALSMHEDNDDDIIDVEVTPNDE